VAIAAGGGEAQHSKTQRVVMYYSDLWILQPRRPIWPLDPAGEFGRQVAGDSELW
jgi:hypothetical protein